MSKNPLLNGLAAFAYILLVVLVMFWGSKGAEQSASFLFPIVLLCVFTLSAAVMGYIFGLQPIRLYVDGHKKLAVELFLKTILVFACITALMVILVFGGLIKI